MEIILAQPRGFCAGVERAIKIVEKALEVYPDKEIYVLHEIVHNHYILSSLRERGVNFVDTIHEIQNQDAVIIFSAHGTAKDVITKAKAKFPIVLDATCPLVTKVHKEIERNARNQKENILIGHKGHQEVIGTMGQIEKKVHLVQSVDDVEKLQVQNPQNLSYVTQTTLSIDDTINIIRALKSKFPYIQGPNLKDVCYATQNRQNAVKDLAKVTDVILVLGSKNSSNSMRLCEVSQLQNVPSYLIDDCKDLDLSWLDNATRIGITAGASAPEILVTRVIEFLKSKYNKVTVRTLNTIKEKVSFKLPQI